MLDLASVDKLNRAGFVVAPYNTPEEVPSVKSVSGPARHVGEADKRVRDSRGGSPCGENRCGIGECREGEGTRGAPQERAKLTRTIFYFLRSEVSSIEKYDAPRRMVFFDLSAQLWTRLGRPGWEDTIFELLPASACLLVPARIKLIFFVEKILKIFLQKWPLEFPLRLDDLMEKNSRNLKISKSWNLEIFIFYHF